MTYPPLIKEFKGGGGVEMELIKTTEFLALLEKHCIAIVSHTDLGDARLCYKLRSINYQNSVS